MNFIGSRSFNKVLRNLFGSHLSSFHRKISTTPPPLLNQNFETVRRISHFTRYESRGPNNWGIRVVPKEEAYVIERFGKYAKTLTSGVHLLIPGVDRIAYIHTMKELEISFPSQSASTRDNVTILIDSFLHVKIVDPKLASYQVANPFDAIIQLAQATVKSEVRKIPHKKISSKLDPLKENILITISEAAKRWGLQCLSYEISKITAGASVVMEKKPKPQSMSFKIIEDKRMLPKSGGQEKEKGIN